LIERNSKQGTQIPSGKIAKNTTSQAKRGQFTDGKVTQRLFSFDTSKVLENCSPYFTALQYILILKLKSHILTQEC